MFDSKRSTVSAAAAAALPVPGKFCFHDRPTCVSSGKNDFLNVSFSGKWLSFWNISVNQQPQYPIISKLAPNWLTNVKVFDLTIFWDRPFLKNSRGSRRQHEIENILKFVSAVM